MTATVVGRMARSSSVQSSMVLALAQISRAIAQSTTVYANETLGRRSGDHEALCVMGNWARIFICNEQFFLQSQNWFCKHDPRTRQSLIVASSSTSFPLIAGPLHGHDRAPVLPESTNITHRGSRGDNSEGHNPGLGDGQC